jgi:DNA polymerase
MSLQLDARQQAMLAVMGVRLFGPQPGPQREDATVAVAGKPAAAKPVSPPSVQATPTPAARQAAPAPATAPAGVELLGWDALAQAVSACRACALCDGRRNAVFGSGDRQADWLVVADPPGENDDLQGEPFVGDEGKLLDNMLKAMGLDRRRNVYLANVLRCRPPGHRNPGPRELAQCEPFLRRQVELLQPKVILAMGRFAVPSLLGSAEPIGKLRGRVHEYLGVPVVVTYDPAYLLRNLADKARAWADLCLALEVMRERS